MEIWMKNYGLMDHKAVFKKGWNIWQYLLTINVFDKNIGILAMEHCQILAMEHCQILAMEHCQIFHRIPILMNIPVFYN